MTVSRRLRFEVLRRDGHACRYCGAMAPDVPLTVDHVIPVALGGGDDPTNLVTACRDCNAGKASTSPDEELVAEVDATALLFRKAMVKAQEVHRSELDAIAAVVAEWDERWDDWKAGEYSIYRPDNWRSVVSGYLQQGLGRDDVLELIDVAMHSRAKPGDTWAYFCGCCKNRIADRTELARRLIEDGRV